MNCPDNMLDLKHTLAKNYFDGLQFYWQAFKELKSFINALGETLGSDFVSAGNNVWVHKSAIIAPSAYLGESVIIGARTEVRHCAFIRGSTLIGEGCVVGNSTEIKNSVLFDGVQAPHFNYVGDSVLGYKSHLGAGAVTSNVKSDKSVITAHMCGVKAITGLKKLGALVGDYAEIGCGSVLNPGSVIGRGASVYPLCSVRGYVPPDSIFKSQTSINKKTG